MAAAAENSDTKQSNEYATVSVADLRVGGLLRAPIYDTRTDTDVLLLSQGTKLTSSLLMRIKQRGITQVRVLRSELERLLGGDGQETAPRKVHKSKHEDDERIADSRWVKKVDSFVNKINMHRMSCYDANKVAHFVESYKESIGLIENLFDGLAAGDMSNAAKMAMVSSDSLISIADDLDMFVAMGLSPVTDKYPCRHSLQTAMLAMSVGTVLGLTRDELTELGVGCLIHDIGMLHIDMDLVNSQRILGTIEFLEITKHPIITYNLMENVREISNGSRMVAYQMHERCDGSGYPRQRVAKQIHYLSKIAAVADVFVAMVSPRPHRPGMLPYVAMEKILFEAREGKFDSVVVRGMLQTISLFPIGSFVEMTDDRIGKVVRSNRDNYARPIVELWSLDPKHPKSELVDLKKETDLQIRRAIAELPMLELPPQSKAESEPAVEPETETEAETAPEAMQLLA